MGPIEHAMVATSGIEFDTPKKGIPMKLLPLLNRVVIRRHEPEKSSEGGILLPDVSQQRPNKGTILSVGPGKVNEKGVFIPTTLKIDDVVYFGTYVGSELEHEGETVVILSEDDILGKLLP